MAAFTILVEAAARQNLRKERVFRDRTSQFDMLTDGELIARYRMPREALLEVLHGVSGLLQHETHRSQALSPETQLLVTLRYLSKGGFLMEMGDLHGVSESSVSRAFDRTLDALIAALPPIKFPAGDALLPVQHSFFRIGGMPKVIGAIDGTIIPIKRPVLDEAAYVCRKGFHSVNVQAICDPDLRFLNVVAKWPGSTHDAFIFTNSVLGQTFEENHPDGWLLGDSGYPCRPWLMTPLAEPQTRAQEKYNRAHIRTRNTIERAFGVLKSRFRCLHKSTGCLQFSPQKCVKIIHACFLLHNFCLRFNLPDIEIEDGGDENNNDDYDNTPDDGQRVRQLLIDRVFS